jgi:hypothetical protein
LAFLNRTKPSRKGKGLEASFASLADSAAAGLASRTRHFHLVANIANARGRMTGIAVGRAIGVGCALYANRFVA